MKFPDSLPKNCPPKQAKSVEMQAYYLVSSPIVLEDFLSLSQRNPRRGYRSAEEECQANGLSVFGNINHIKRVRAGVKRLRDKSISVGNLTPECGVVRPTPSHSGSSHCTWWIAVGVEPWQMFTIIEDRKL
jgi:hypothetical protein